MNNGTQQVATAVSAQTPKKKGNSCFGVLIALFIFALVCVGLLGFVAYQAVNETVESASVYLSESSKLEDEWTKALTEVDETAIEPLALSLKEFFDDNRSSGSDNLVMSAEQVRSFILSLPPVRQWAEHENLRFIPSLEDGFIKIKVEVSTSVLLHFLPEFVISHYQLGNKFIYAEGQLSFRIREGRSFLALHSLAVGPEVSPLPEELVSQLRGENLLEDERMSELAKTLPKSLLSAEIKGNELHLKRRPLAPEQVKSEERPTQV